MKKFVPLTAAIIKTLLNIIEGKSLEVLYRYLNDTAPRIDKC
jgi:hypothetical protein